MVCTKQYYNFVFNNLRKEAWLCLLQRVKRLEQNYKDSTACQIQTSNPEGKEKSRWVRVVETEVYSRVVGYYRPVSNWNQGKQQEFSERHFHEY